MLPAFDTAEAALLSAWLLVGSFLIRLGWSSGGWARRQLLKDWPVGLRRIPKQTSGRPTSEGGRLSADGAGGLGRTR